MRHVYQRGAQISYVNILRASVPDNVNIDIGVKYVSLSLQDRYVVSMASAYSVLKE